MWNFIFITLLNLPFTDLSLSSLISNLDGDGKTDAGAMIVNEAGQGHTEVVKALLKGNPDKVWPKLALTGPHFVPSLPQLLKLYTYCNLTLLLIVTIITVNLVLRSRKHQLLPLQYILQVVKLYTVVKWKRIFLKKTDVSDCCPSLQWIHSFTRIHSDEGLQSETSVFFKFFLHSLPGVKFNYCTCKTVSIETPTQHSIYDLCSMAQLVTVPLLQMSVVSIVLSLDSLSQLKGCLQYSTWCMIYNNQYCYSVVRDGSECFAYK